MTDHPRIHDLKTWPEFFEALVAGTKTFEYRLNDRDYQPGDFLRLREWVPSSRAGTGTYTGRELHFEIGYVLHSSDEGRRAAILSLLPIEHCQHNPHHGEAQHDSA